MIHDAHFHCEDQAFITFLVKHHIHGIVNAATLREYEQLHSWVKPSYGIEISAGIHPWHVDQIDFDTMLPILQKVNIIGEIGLDNVWCEVDYDKQYEVLERQLAFAAQNHKPVILHVKGLEKELLPLLHHYNNQYLVHWYSCEAYLDDFIDCDCYFSVGPSINSDRAVQQVAKQVPLNRLLLESDGLSALSWCEKRPISIHEYLDIMYRSLKRIQNIRQVSDMEARLNENLLRFLTHAKQ